MAGDAVPGDLPELLDEYFRLDFERFLVRHTRARALAGPSLMGGARGIEHWTFDYVRRHVDTCLRDVSMLVLELAEERGFAPAAAVPQVRQRLAEHFESIHQRLFTDTQAPQAHEYDVRPSWEALAAVQRHAMERLASAMTALSAGRLEARLVPRVSPFSRLITAAGGGDRLLLIVAAAAAVLAMIAVL